MLEITPRATRAVAEHLKGRADASIRLFVRLGGCGIRTFGLALEEPRKSDRVFSIDGFTYIVNHKLLAMVAPIRVDSDGICFRISGRGISASTGCGNCGSFCGMQGGRRCIGDCDRCQHPCGHRQEAP